MSGFLLSFLGSLLGTGVPMVALAVLIKRQASVNNAPKPLRPCSCAHGFGMHTKDGCVHLERKIVNDGKPVILTDMMGNQRMGKGTSETKVIDVPCPCKRFDGEIPADMIGREWMGIE